MGAALGSPTNVLRANFTFALPQFNKTKITKYFINDYTMYRLTVPKTSEALVNRV